MASHDETIEQYENQAMLDVRTKGGYFEQKLASPQFIGNRALFEALDAMEKRIEALESKLRSL